MRLFLFELGGEWFALRGEQVRGVLPGEASADAPRLRVPGNASSASATNLLVVARPGGVEALLEVDRVEGLTELREEAVHRVPSFVFPEGSAMVSGVFEWRGALAVLLDPEALERPDLPLAS